MEQAALYCDESCHLEHDVYCVVLIPDNHKKWEVICQWNKLPSTAMSLVI